MTPPAPPRFSMITSALSFAGRPPAIVRAIRSTGPPAAKGTTILIWSAAAAGNTDANRNAAVSQRFMGSTSEALVAQARSPDGAQRHPGKIVHPRAADPGLRRDY